MTDPSTTPARPNCSRPRSSISTSRSFDARPIVDAMKKMSFTSRDLGRATDIYNQMLADKDCSIFLVIAGSTRRAAAWTSMPSCCATT